MLKTESTPESKEKKSFCEERKGSYQQRSYDTPVMSKRTTKRTVIVVWKEYLEIYLIYSKGIKFWVTLQLLLKGKKAKDILEGYSTGGTR